VRSAIKQEPAERVGSVLLLKLKIDDAEILGHHGRDIMDMGLNGRFDMTYLPVTVAQKSTLRPRHVIFWDRVLDRFAPGLSLFRYSCIG
jgi:hypothetical protein